ncbi:unnamed protein product, partial [marine sediment metagenome]
SEGVKQQIYEILGISDIIRGANTRASESATAQNLKGQWANVRLREDTSDVARLWKDVFRIMAEIMAEHFDPMQLQLMTGIEVTPEMVEIMRSDIGRSFAVDIETDSTIATDDEADRAETMELVTTINGYLEQTIPAVQSGALPVNFVTETLTFMVSKFKNGKQLEDVVAELQPHLEGLVNFQQQMQQMQEQMGQMQEGLMQKDQQLQQAGQQIEGMGKELQKFNERKEGREDAKTRSEIENTQSDNQRDGISTMADAKQKAADTDLKGAQADKVRSETEIGVLQAFTGNG